MASDSSPAETQPYSSSWSEVSKGTLIGAVSIHAAILIFAWIRGAIWGSAGDPSEVLPWATEDAVQPGWEGGMKSANELFALYAFSLGTIPVVFSIIGAIAGFVLCVSSRRRLADDSASIVSTLVYAAAAYLTDTVARAMIFGSLGPMGWSGSGSLLWLTVVLVAIIWGTSVAAAYLRHRRWQIATGIGAIGASLFLMRANYFAPPPGLTLAAVLLLIYAAATNKGFSRTTVKTGSMPDVNINESAPVKPSGANGLAVFLFGGFSFYAFVCLFTLFAVMGNRGTDNWGVFMPIVIGLWGIPIFGTLAAILHAWTGPWAWLSNRQAWLSATCAFVVCLLLWVVIILTQ